MTTWSKTEAAATGPDLRQRRRRDNRTATVEAAFTLFARHGYDQVTVADICEAAEIGRRTFFRYFTTKDDVLSEPAREMAAHVANAIAAAPADESDGTVLRQALTSVAEYALEHRARLRQLRAILQASTNSGWSPFLRLSDQEAQIAEQMSTRRGIDGKPDWEMRLLVARAIGGYRVWLDDLADGAVPDDHRHLDEIFALDLLLSRPSE